MSPNGTAAYDSVADLPPLVERAVNLARQDGFGDSCRQEHGRLLFALAAGAEVIGETGTGGGSPQVTVRQGDWSEIYSYGPFDLLVLDGGAHGKSGARPADPDILLRPGGTLVIDDLTPAQDWPSRFAGLVDEARMHWLGYSGLDATELRLAPDLAALVATRRFPGTR